MLRLLLIQLCRPPLVPKPLQKLYDICNNEYPPKIPTDRELTEAFNELLCGSTGETIGSGASSQPESEAHSRVFVLVDGLDEVLWSRRSEYYSLLSQLARFKLSRLHLLVFSRTQSSIQQVMSAPVPWKEMVIDEDMVQPDIRLYVCHTIKSNPWQYGDLSETVIEEIIEKIAGKGSGM